MKFVSVAAHGAIDYLFAIFLISSPGLLDYYQGGKETWIVIIGLLTLIYSVCTDYTLGFFKVISLDTHLSFDLFAGLILAISPWILGFNNNVSLPHFLFGIFEIIIWLLTRLTLEYKSRN